MSASHEAEGKDRRCNDMKSNDAKLVEGWLKESIQKAGNGLPQQATAMLHEMPLSERRPNE